MPDNESATKGYEQDRGQRKAHGGWQSQYIDSQPVRNHITRLRLAGMGIKQIARRCGISPGAVQIILDRRTGSAVKVLPSTAAKILAVAVPPAPGVIPAGRQRVSAIGTTRRLRALVAAGYTPAMLSHELGITPMNNAYELFGHRDDMPAVIAQAVADLFDRLEMTPGPSDRARALAHKLGWASPLAWDEDMIDDAAAHPSRAADKHVRFPERYRELRELGVHDELAIAGRLGMKVDSLQRQLARYREEVLV
jgi:AraC-like DNA-binding protein